MSKRGVRFLCTFYGMGWVNTKRLKIKLLLIKKPLYAVITIMNVLLIGQWS